MSTHLAVVITSVHGPLEAIRVPTVKPEQGEVLVRVQWTASTPLDMHQNDGGMFVSKHPYVSGSCMAGTVVELGPRVENLKVDDLVFGFAWREQKEKAHQEFATVPEFLLGKIPEGFTPQEAVTLPNNFVTVFHAATANLGLPLEWPRPVELPSKWNVPILIWGASSSVGQYALQIFKYWGYTSLIAIAGKAHHENLKSLGAKYTFDYRDSDVGASILKAAKSEKKDSPIIPYILDCIGSQSGSVEPIATIAESGAKVAVLLPVILKSSTETTMPEYSMEAVADWKKDVEVLGVQTRLYLENNLFKEQLQSVIMPKLLAEGVVKPNKQRIVEGKTLVERAEAALTLLRRREMSGERLVWKISEL